MKQKHLEKAKELLNFILDYTDKLQVVGYARPEDCINKIAQALAEAEEKGRQVTIEEIEKFINGIEETWINIPPLRITILKNKEFYGIDYNKDKLKWKLKETKK